jgi:hypothetical protein
MQATQNPLPPGRYRIDLFSPTPNAPHVRDGVPVFKKWRLKNETRVKVLHVEAWATEPHQTRVLFELTERPGAWPFGALGPPELASDISGAASLIQIAEFLLDPLGTAIGTASNAAAKFMADLAAPELAHVRDAIIVTRANLAMARGVLEAIRNGTASDPHEGLAAVLQLCNQSRQALTAALGAVTIDFPRRIVMKLLADIQALEQAVKNAPSQALHAAVQAVKDVVVPFELSSLGTTIAVGAIGWALFSGKKIDTNILLVGAGVLALGLGMFNPPVPGKATP